MLQAIERYMKQAIVDRSPAISSAALVKIYLFILKNSILLSKLFCPNVRKIVLVIEKKLRNSRLKAETLQTYKQEQFIQTKVTTIFVNRMIF